MTVYLLCGLPASGKTYICERLGWSYVPNDSYMNRESSLVQAVVQIASRARLTPVITDCPFGERVRREMLESMRIQVIPYFVLESVDVLWKRYQARPQRPLKREYFVSRAPGLKQRAIEWRAPHGTSDQILNLLKGVK